MQPSNKKIRSKFNQISIFIGYITLFAGIISIIGWPNSLKSYITFLSIFPNIQPLTSISFIAMGLGLIFYHKRTNSTFLFIVNILILVITILSSVDLIDLYFFDVNNNLQFFLQAVVPQSLRLGSITALCIFLTSLSFLTLVSPSLFIVTEIISIGVIFMSIFRVTAFLFSFHNIVTFSYLANFALHTSIGIGLINIGILLAKNNSGLAQLFSSNLIGSKQVRRTIPIAFIVPTSLFYLAILGEKYHIFDRESRVIIITQLFIATSSFFIIRSSYRLNRIDISRRNKEKLIKEKEANLFALIENTDQPIWSVDREMHLIGLNTIYKQSISSNYQMDISVGDYLMDAYPLSDHEKIMALYNRCFRGERFSYQHKEKTAKGISHHETSFNPIVNESGEVLGAVIFGRDITHIKKVEGELINAKINAEKASLIKSQFLSTMSHEIRTPLNAVIGMTYLLKQDSPRPDQEQRLNTLNFSASNLMSLINDILDFNKIESGIIEFENIAFDLGELLEEIKTTFEQKARDKNLSLEFNLDERIKYHLIGDPSRLSQVLNNLIGNAIKFTNEGKVTLQVSCSCEYLTENYCDLTFSIRDTGIGIAKEKILSIFDRFTQASSDTTRKFGGTGLGLAISKKLLELQGSVLYVESILDHGSNFYFHIKFPITKNQNAQNAISKMEGEKNLHELRILLVEDNPINRFVAIEFLKKWNARVDFAENGILCLEMLKTIEYDLILMDLQMPEMDGYETTKAIRISEMGTNKHIPIIALTASALLDVKEQVSTIGMDDYVCKPFNPEELYQKISKCITNS